MLIIASGGLLVNGAGLAILHGGRGENLNMRDAWLHVLTDAIGSLQAIVAGALIWAYGWRWVDPAASVLIGLLVIYSSWSLITQSVAVLMEGAHRRRRRAASAARTATRQSCSRPARLDDHQRVRRALSACHES